MKKSKLKSLWQQAVATGCMGLGLLGLSTFLSTAQAYEIKTVFHTEHFAINQVILGQNETLDGPTQSSITGDIQTLNRSNKLYQSTTVVFPAGSPGYTGRINTPIEGVLTISNYNSNKDRIFFDTNAQYAANGGLYIGYEQLSEMINQKVLNTLIGELKDLPVVYTDVPVSGTGFDPTTNSFFVTGISDATILDARIDDSTYYTKETYYKLNKSCKVDLLFFTDRIVPNIPLFISGRAAINRITCTQPLDQAQQPQQQQ